jgi:hypothetical protein
MAKAECSRVLLKRLIVVVYRRISWGRDGAQGRNRTTDTVIFSHVLYQLSYLGGWRRRGAARAYKRPRRALSSLGAGSGSEGVQSPVAWTSARRPAINMPHSKPQCFAR